MRPHLLTTLLLSTSLSAAGCLGPLGGNSAGGGDTPSCDSFTACGGDLNGTWELDSTCAQGELSAVLLAEDNAPQACSDLYSSVSMQLTGAIQYANGVETANLTITRTYTAVYTAPCLSAMSNSTVTVTEAGCANAQSTLNARSNTTASCQFDGDNCSCQVEQRTGGTPTVDSYTIADGSLTYSGGNSSQFCVQGSTALFRLPLAGGALLGLTAHRTQ
jgi:hypothetical protein